MIAGLPMYDFPWTAAALDRVWTGIAARLAAAGLDPPPKLTRGLELESLWRAPDLLFGQTCGYPYRQGLQDLVEIVATPVFDFDGAVGATHMSLIVARQNDPRADLAAFRGARAAINARDSNTGMNLLRASVAPLSAGAPFFSEIIVTSAHIASLSAVADGAADIAAIDCVTFGLVARYAPERIEAVRILGRTPATPCLPFIVSRALPEATRTLVRKALFEALTAPELKVAWATLGVLSAVVLPPDAYLRIDELEAEAGRLNYPELA